MTIENKILVDADKGRAVTFTRAGDHGILKSWNDFYCFVVFNCDDNWGQFQQYSSEAVNADDLIWGWHGQHASPPGEAQRIA
jgi:hypothetical protein